MCVWREDARLFSRGSQRLSVEGGGLFLTGIGLTILCDITAISTDFQGHWDGLHAFCREKKVTEVPDVLG